MQDVDRHEPIQPTSLSPARPARRLFAHFFDIHFLAERGAIDPASLRGEARRAFRLALLLFEQVLVPASSYFESSLCRGVLNEFDPEIFASRISFVASGTNFEEFLEGKFIQYGTDDPQGRIYRAAGNGLAFPWTNRARSATRDIAADWNRGMQEHGMERLAQALGAERPPDLERRLAEVPERLAGTAFIASNAARIITGGRETTLQFGNRLLGVINDAYFASYARDLGAAVVQDMAWLGSSGRLPSGDPAHDLEYRPMLEACRAAGFLKALQMTRPHHLIALRDDVRLQRACAAATDAARRDRGYLEASGIMTTKAAPPPAATTTFTDGPAWSKAKDVKVLVVTALPEEEAAMLAVCDRHRNVGNRGDRAIYRQAEIALDNGERRPIIVTTASKMGKAEAAALTANALRSFPDVEHVLMVGIAAGVPNPSNPDEHVRLGDIVVSDHHGVVEYDNVKIRDGTVERRGAPQSPSAAVLQAHRALQADAQLGARPWEDAIDQGLARLAGGDDDYRRPAPETDVLKSEGKEAPHPDDRRRRDGRPRVFGGAIATGDALVKDEKLRNELRDRFGARALEMEGSAVQSAAWSGGKDAFIVRGSSDYGDGLKNDLWRHAASLAAAAYARSLIQIMPREWFP